MDWNACIDRLASGVAPDAGELAALIGGADAMAREYAAGAADALTVARFGQGVFVRGLVEVSNYCRNDCLYCGIRKSNAGVSRYRLSRDEILAQCREGYGMGMRTFVLQGGEDPALTDDFLAGVVEKIRKEFADCAVTLSVGERSRKSYLQLFQAGAERYLLRHETANTEHYARLHPPAMTLDSRVECLFALKEIGYQVGSGFMVGTPFQTAENLAEDLLFLKKLGPAMVGLGPFIPHAGTPLGGYAGGRVELTLFMLSLVRLMFPRALLPATTALASATEDGRERGLLAGGNVVMPNLTPRGVREKYEIYGGKEVLGLKELEGRLRGIGRHIEIGRGDYRDCD